MRSRHHADARAADRSFGRPPPPGLARRGRRQAERAAAGAKPSAPRPALGVQPRRTRERMSS
jgi:hypothetical protein